MKKTYNVYSRNSLKLLSVTFFFTLFFLGMSSSASAQYATSRTAGAVSNADFSITLKAQIGVTDELAMQILEAEMEDVREEARDNNLTPAQEAENSARAAFLSTALSAVNDKKFGIKDALFQGQQELERMVSNFNSQIRTIVDSEGIAREYVNRLK